MRSSYPQYVKDIKLRPGMNVSELIRQMGGGGGFGAKHVAEGLEILCEMEKKEDCVKFLSFPAAMMATGLRGVLTELIRRGLFDVIITASGTVDHDLARVWGRYHPGSFDMDDRELWKKGIHRLGNILIPREGYGPLLEKKLQPFFRRLYAKGVREVSSYELCRHLGIWIDDEESLLYWGAKKDIPIFLPGVFDGSFGSQIWLFTQTHRDFRMNLNDDEDFLAEKVFKAKTTGALIIGGGISKHHTLWHNQFRGGLDYAVYITTAVEYDGSLSGARIKEAISWGKVGPRAKHTTIFGDATYLLPFMALALLERLGSHERDLKFPE